MKTLLNCETIVSHIFRDMAEPVRCLPKAVYIGLAVAAFAVFLIRFINRHIKHQLFAGGGHRNRQLYLRVFVLFLFAVYLAVLLEVAFFSRPPGSRTSVNLKLFGTWGGGSQGRAYVIENIIMFIPWGVLLPLLMKHIYIRPWLCVLYAFLASVSLETVQFLTQRGHGQLDDVVMNTLGALIGCMAVRIMRLCKIFP